MNGDDDTELNLPLRGLPNVPNLTGQPQEEPPEEDLSTSPIQQLPEQMGVPPETMVVRGMYYGKHFGEHNRGANFGPEGQELQDDDVALSNNVAEQLGLRRGDKIWVGNQLHTYNDISAYSPTHLTRNSVEVRNYPLDGKIQVRKAMPDEVARYQRGEMSAQMPSAQRVAMMTGLDPSKITAADVNAVIQPEIEKQRGLIAGDVTGASLENWNLDQLNQQQEIASDPLADESGEITPASMGLETSPAQLPGGVSTDAGEGIPVPSMRGAHIIDRKDGKLIWSNGIIGDPTTGIIQYQLGPKTVTRFPDGRTQSFNTNDIYRDPGTGYTYDKTKPGMPRVVLEGQIPDLKPGVTGEAALADLTEPQKNIVRMIANYQLVLPPGAMRSASFLPYLARVSAYNPDYSMMKATGRQQMIKSLANMNPNSAGYILMSANTMLQHLQQLSKDAEKLPLSKWKKGNQFVNFLHDNAGDPSITNFQFTKNALLTELTKTLKGGVADEGDMRRWSDAVNAADSKAQLDDLIKKDFPDILAGRLNGFRFLYQNVMDHPYERTDPKTGQRTTLISPANAAWLKSIGYDGNIDAGDPVQQPAKEIQNVQAGLPAKGTADVQGAMLWLAQNPDDKRAPEIRDYLLRLGVLPSPSPTPTPAK